MLPQFQTFGYVPCRDEYLNLFPHRYDFIRAKHHRWNEKPEWKTESRYPLSDRLIEQAAQLYGVRFGKFTKYALVDVDAGSCYLTSAALARIRASLEPIGLVACVPVQSSGSKGLHLFYPLGSSQNSDQVALAIATLLEQAGFTLAPGQLEIFPNVRTSIAGEQPSLFNAHRLPLQDAGSVLLSDDLTGYAHSSQASFVQRWQFAERRNDCTEMAIARVLQRRRKQYRISSSAAKFLADLDADIEAGWTAHGQTNFLLGRITLRTYVFGHLLGSAKPLEGEALAERVQAIAQSLPGFSEWCRHQEELSQRVKDWCRSVESSRYFPYGSRSSAKQKESSWNQEQQQGAIARIKQAIGQLGESIPQTVRSLCAALEKLAHVSRSTLYKHAELWRNLLQQSASEAPAEVSETASDRPLHPSPPNKLCAVVAVTDAPQQSSYSPQADQVGGVRGGFPQLLRLPPYPE